MSTPWDVWMNMFSSCNEGNPYTQGTKCFQEGISAYWQMPAAYWQAVTSIYDARARTWQGMMANAPRYWSTLSQCKTAPEWTETCMKAYGENTVALMNLAATVQSHRMHLLNQWHASATRMTPLPLRAASTTSLMNVWMKSLQTAQGWQGPWNMTQMAWPNMHNMGTSAGPLWTQLFSPTKGMSTLWDMQANMCRPFFQSMQATGAATSPNTPTPPKGGKSQSAAASASESKASEKAEATKTPTGGTVAAAASNTPTPAQPAEQPKPVQAKAVAASDNQMNLLTPPTASDDHHTPGLNGTPHHSSTAGNGVVRSSGAIVASAAAAAARRSVVARRTSRSRTRVVRPAR